MRILERFFILRLVAYGILSLCIAGGAVTYASTLMAAQQTASTSTLGQSAIPHFKSTNMAYPDSAQLQQHNSTGGFAMNQAPAGSRAHFLPVILWFFGSAVLAMVGYKRMRNTEL